jgi:hypothetical protein
MGVMHYRLKFNQKGSVYATVFNRATTLPGTDPLAATNRAAMIFAQKPGIHL